MVIDIYFGVNPKNPIEIEIVKEVKPKCIMLSYYYWQNKDLIALVDKLGYKPKIMMDSGGFSGQISTIEYIYYIKEYKDLIDHYISPDYLGPVDNENLAEYFAEITSVEFMKFEDHGLDYPIPVYHYGEPLEILEVYENGFYCDYIALGNTVGKLHYSKVQRLINELSKRSLADFHLLGSTARSHLENTDILSCDSTTWIKQAKMYGQPDFLDTVWERAVFNMKMIEQRYPESYLNQIKYGGKQVKTLF